MARQFTCAYANCGELGEAVLVNMPGNPGERARFCCAEHAAGYLLRAARLRHPHGSFPEVQLADVEKYLQARIGKGGK